MGQRQIQMLNSLHSWNHELYGGQLGNTLQKLCALQDGQIHMLDCEAMELNGVRFMETTGWADDKALGDPATVARAAQNSMTDFKQIRTANHQRARPSDYANL